MNRLILLLSLLLAWPALADEPQVIVDTRLVPDKQITVGGVIELQVDLLVDTWFTAAPQLPKLELPGALVTGPSSEAAHLNQQRDGKPFFGLRFTYRITPQQAQDFAIAALDIQVQPGQGSGTQTVQSQPQRFSAVRPTGMTDGEHALVARTLTFSQNLVRSHDPLRVGDSISRQLSIRAEGAQAMLIPPPQLAEVEGLKRYVQTPQVRPLDDGRGSVSGGQRDDSATYVVSEPGEYTLPAIELKWWDESGQAQTATVPEVTFEAQGGSAYQTPFSVSDDLRRLGHRTQVRIARHWLVLSLLLIVVGLAGYFGRPWWQRGVSALRQWRAARRQAWLDSPEYAWQQLRAQLDASPTQLDSLYRWVKRSTGSNQLRGLYAQLPSPMKQPLLGFIETRYGTRTATPPDTADLKQALEQAHHSLQQRQAAKPSGRGLQPLNPSHSEH